MPIGMQAFQNYNPIRAITDPTQPGIFYRTVRSLWHLSSDVFFLLSPLFETAHDDGGDPSLSFLVHFFRLFLFSVFIFIFPFLSIFLVSSLVRAAGTLHHRM